MSLFILDTDILTLYCQQHPIVVWRALAHLADDLAITSINVEEAVQGWLLAIRNAVRPDRIERGHVGLSDIVPFLGSWIIIPYTESALGIYEQLRKMRLNVGTNDLRIAAVALEHNATVVTRNLCDFQRVPNLPVENWAA
jgi:tRNA(fMet)-specific endonuclease VapC